MRKYFQQKQFLILFLIFSSFFLMKCGKKSAKSETSVDAKTMKEKQITFEHKTHALDNNDNFSSDGKYLCYDTRGMVFNNNLANSKSIEKVEIATGEITVLWKPESISGENAAPGVAAVSYHPMENKVIFIHGPLLDEVDERGYYDIRNRTGVLVSADGKGNIIKVDRRDVATNKPTIQGAQRGGTHRHEYSRDGKRIGFTYDDFIQKNYDRTIGYMEAHENAPQGYTHYFAVLLKPAKKGESKPGEIEKAYGDSWIDFKGNKRAFIGKVRAENGVDYENSLFIAEIPDDIDIASAYSGDKDNYPNPPKGIRIRRLTHSTSDDGIVRGSYDGKKIAYLSKDSHGVKQVFIIPTNGSDQAKKNNMHPNQITNFISDASNIRWHISNNWIFSISDGKIYANNIGNSEEMGKSILLTSSDLNRSNLVVSRQGDVLAYNVAITHKDSEIIVEGKPKKDFDQIFVLKLDAKLIK